MKLKVCRILIIIDILFIFFISYIAYINRIKNPNVELGITSLSMNYFTSNNRKSKCVIDDKNVNYYKAGTYDVIIKCDNNTYNKKVKLSDTKNPVVIFTDIYKPAGYKINPEDFVLLAEDSSSVNVFVDNDDIDTSKYGKYNVKVTVRDESNNETYKDCVLNISQVKTNIIHELGEEFSIDEIVVEENIKDLIDKDLFNKVDVKKVGTYNISLNINNIKYNIKINVNDTVAPTLDIKNVLIYNDKKANIDDFIVSSSDESEYEVKMLNEIDYNNKNNQNISIEAKDIYGNSIIKTSTVSFGTDDEGPVFSNANVETVFVGDSFDFKKGVKAIDNVDGKCAFEVDSSNVDLSTVGTYYAIYSSKDKSNNSTTFKRKINVVLKEDKNELLKEFYDKYLIGKSVREIAITIRKNIYYSSNDGGNDPVWYALKYKKGNCGVHALLFEAVLNYAGYDNELIINKYKTHMWNLVQEDGVWRHYDSTPGNDLIGPNTDIEVINGKDKYKVWDRSKYPEAN